MSKCVLPSAAAVFVLQYPATWMHELGHNLYLNHAGSYQYQDGVSQYVEYKDDSGTMGHCCDTRCYNAPHSFQLGWSKPLGVLHKGNFPTGESVVGGDVVLHTCATVYATGSPCCWQHVVPLLRSLWHLLGPASHTCLFSVVSRGCLLTPLHAMQLHAVQRVRLCCCRAH